VQLVIIATGRDSCDGCDCAILDNEWTGEAIRRAGILR
jgi:hypothetical protein